MQRTLLHGKIHRVTVTAAELNYIGSCAIDQDLLDAANIMEYEQIDLWNVTNGERFTTYAISAPAGSGVISVNGSAARRVQIGDILIIAAFAQVDASELNDFTANVVFVNDTNHITEHQRIRPTLPKMLKK
ncbi:MAG: aspartate 1-decarboxylase [Burkholderiales bacterium]|jgi:aspartate 1-decarboxylase|nr:aspartate 1-decarboxylase [Burkholderiales bacterium]MCE1175872.1 aspartate 1-decarboxylase [Burkholderiales bacterium]